MVYFTDGFGPAPAEPPPVPVVWCLVPCGQPPAPWGRVSGLTNGDRRLRVLQEWFGYTLLCDGRFQKFLLMVGEGRNGKGVIQNLWVQMLGAENVAHVSLDQLSGRFAMQPLLGKMANICGDLCEIDAVAEGVLKRAHRPGQRHGRPARTSRRSPWPRP